MAVNLGSAVAYLELDTSKFTSGFVSAARDLKVFTSKTATAEQKMKGLSSAMGKTGSVLNKTVTLPLLGVGAAAVKTSADFESAMSQVAATMGTTTDKIEDLRQTAIRMGSTTSFTAKEAAEGLNILAMSGLNAEEQMAALPSVLDLAAAGALSLDSAAGYVTATVKGFADSMDNAAYYTDIMAKGATMANTDVNMLGVAMSDASATANNYGQSAESMTLSLLRLAEQNVTGAEAATALNRAMMDLYTPTSSAKKTLDELGISAYDSTGKARDFNDIVDELNDSFSRMSDEEANVTKNAIFTTYGLQAFNKMTVSSTEKVNDFKKGLSEAGGSAAQQAQTQLDNLKGSITLMTSALEGAGIIIGDYFVPYIRKAADFINKVATRFNELSKEQKDNVVRWVAIAAAAGPVLSIGSKLIKLFVSLKSNLSVLSTLIKMISVPAPIMAVVAAVGALVGAFMTLWKTNEDFRESISNTFGRLKDVLKNTVDKVLDLISDLMSTYGKYFSNLIDVIKAVWKGFCDIIAPLFTEGFSVIVDVVESVLGVITGLFELLVGLVTGDLEKVKSGALNIFESMIKGIYNILTGLIKMVAKIGENILKALGLEDVAENIKTFFMETIPNAIKSAFDSVKQFSDNVRTFFTETIPDAFNGFIETVSNIANSITEFFTVTIPEAIYDFVFVTIPDLLDSLLQWFEELPYNIGYALGSIAGYFTLMGDAIMEWVLNDLPQIVDNIVNWFAQLPGRIWDWLQETIANIQQWGTDVYNKASEACSEFLESVSEYFSQLPGRIWEWLVSTYGRITSWASEMKARAIKAATDFVLGFINYMKNLPSKVWDIISKIPQKIESIKSQMKSAGANIFKSLFDGIKSIGSSIIGWVSDFAGKIKSFVSGIVSGFRDVVNGANNAKSATKSVRSVSGSHANGLDYVPFNGYVAELHEGERVLTKQENKEYNKGKTSQGDTFIFYNTKPDPYEYSRQMKRAKRELLSET